MKPFEQQTYYEILEVPVTAPMEEIRAAYERLNELYSPDSIAVYALVDEGQVDGLRARMAEALEILSDEELRAEYDKDLGLPARRLMDAAATGGSGAHADAPVEKRAEPTLVGVAAPGAEDETGRLSTQVPEAGTNGRPGAVRDVPVEDSETASTGRDGEAEAADQATEPRAEPMPATLGQADFRASFFRGFSFAYVSSSLQDTQRMGSAVDVPVASIQPQASADGAGTEAVSAESPREASSAVPAASVGEPAVAQEAAAVVPDAVPASDSPVPASASLVPSAPPEPSSPAPEAGPTAIVPVHPGPSAEAQAEPGRAGARAGRPLGDAPQLAQDSAIATAEAALAQVSQVASRAREPRPRIPEIPSDAEFNGELLRQVREARGMTLQQVADRTRITRSHLENVEADRYTALPPAVYLRGILMNLARELGLDPLRVSKSYLALSSEKAGRK
ncbi:helix-turn-helix domain-containing protein [Myxococcus sp. SDU36]|uniref:helix-turn-helix domain-containing protein n=1 Tax=Myxococcus sp. SDU36 TaxID=2831967 RepID=UPI002543F3D0|nr:helix-turn-helix domain-containing protein [Myxococcus sp. SDU36]WIG96942.1 helix-turn-helix domain-containing protein [Myxococcus sp. SDU36]